MNEASNGGTEHAREIRAELDYLLTAAEKPGVISHRDAEDAERRLLEHVDALVSHIGQLERERDGWRNQLG